jgi:DNA-directed RNA polymerase subunit RPC12/RpoP
LKCPYCNKEIPGSACPQCGFPTPEGANYCIECGTNLHQVEVEDSTTDENELDFENRVLCPDGTCTGIIVDGKCTECGKEVKEQENGY